MKIQLINLDRAPERLEFMVHQFVDIGCRFHRIEAVDANNFSETEVDAFRASTMPQRQPHVWSPAQIAIFLSHQKAWSVIADSNDDFGCVMEDDVHMAPSYSHLVSSDHWLPDQDCIIRLETTMQSMALDRMPVLSLDGLQVYKVASESWGSAAYILSRKIAQWLSALPATTFEPVDWFLFHPKSIVPTQFDILQIVPAPCVQDQYHPNRATRHEFERETTAAARRASLIRSIASPFVRMLRRRRIVPYG